MRKQLRRILKSSIVGAIISLIVLLVLYLYTKQIRIIPSILSGVLVAAIEWLLQLKN